MDKQDLITGMYQYGRNQALNLRAQAAMLTDTQVVEAESFIPEWREGPQTLGALVRRQEMDQVYRVLQAHDSTGNPSWTPENTPALFSVCHTTDPEQAKPWAPPQGTSGMYQKDECYRDGNGTVWQQTYEGGTVYDAATLPERWQQVR